MEKVDKFIENIDADLGWRKKEITNLLLLANSDNELLIVKTSLLLLYSHWEGFVKNSSKAYLVLVASKKINISMLTCNFRAISLKGLVKEVQNSSNSLTLSNELKIINKISNDTKKVFTLNKDFSSNEKDKSIINTRDNLSFSVFKSLLNVVGIDYFDCIDTKETFIDEKLLGGRNKVAHGNKIVEIDNEFDLTLDDFKKLKNLIFYLMDAYAGDLKHLAENELFYQSKSEDLTTYLKLKSDYIRQNAP